MHILVKQKLRFTFGGQNFVTEDPDSGIQEAPDWIVNDPYFNMCASNGYLSVINTVPTISTVVPSPTSPVPPLPPTVQDPSIQVPPVQETVEGGAGVPPVQETVESGAGTMDPNPLTAHLS